MFRIKVKIRGETNTKQKNKPKPPFIFLTFSSHPHPGVLSTAAWCTGWIPSYSDPSDNDYLISCLMAARCQPDRVCSFLGINCSEIHSSTRFFQTAHLCMQSSDALIAVKCHGKMQCTPIFFSTSFSGMVESNNMIKRG